MRTQQEVIDRINRMATKALLEQEDADVAELLAHYKRAQRDILAYLNQVFDEMAFTEDGWRLDYMERTGKTKRLLDTINGRISQLIGQSNDAIQTGAVNQYQAATYHAGYMLDQATPSAIAVKFPLLPIPAIKAMVKTPFKGAMFSQRIGVINDAMASDIRDQLLQSMIAGDSMKTAADRVKGVIGIENLENPRGYANRAMTIARSEIMRASNLGRKLVYAENRDLMAGTPIWLATPDRRICKWCLRRDGKSQGEIRKLAAGADPWGKDSVPPLHPNCRCTLLPQLKTWRQMGIDMPEEMDDDVRGMRNGRGKWVTVPVKTFNAWKQDMADIMGVQV